MGMVVLTQVRGDIMTRYPLRSLVRLASLRSLVLVVSLVSLVPLGCSSPEPHPIDYGNTECASCMMMVTDPRFGAEAVTKTGKTYVFDAIECMMGWYLAEDVVTQKDIHSLWVSNHAAPGTLIDVSTALFLHSEELRSPMSMNVASFSSERDRRDAQARYGGEPMTYAQMLGRAEDYR